MNSPIVFLDRTSIQTRLRFHPKFLEDPTAFIRGYGLKIRTFQLGHGKSSVRKIKLAAPSYKGIRVEICQAPGDLLADVSIDFNPGVCLHGHNGAVLSFTELDDAFAVLCSHLSPLLYNQNDEIDLIPGRRACGVAYWKYIEIYIHCIDRDGSLLAAFRNVQGKTSRVPIRHWPGSMMIGGKRSDLVFSIYRKAAEMLAKKKISEDEFKDYENILRLEVRLKNDKLIQYLDNDHNVEVIDGKRRLVRFYPQDLVSAHRRWFETLNGVYSSNAHTETMSSIKPLESLGMLIAKVAVNPQSPHTLEQLLQIIKHYTGASADTINKVRKAGLDEISRQSTIQFSQLFGEDAYQIRASVRNEGLENKVRYECADLLRYTGAFGAYIPPDYPEYPIVEIPTYCRS